MAFSSLRRRNVGNVCLHALEGASTSCTVRTSCTACATSCGRLTTEWRLGTFGPTSLRRSVPSGQPSPPRDCDDGSWRDAVLGQRLVYHFNGCCARVSSPSPCSISMCPSAMTDSCHLHPQAPIPRALPPPPMATGLAYGPGFASTSGYPGVQQVQTDSILSLPYYPLIIDSTLPPSSLCAASPGCASTRSGLPFDMNTRLDQSGIIAQGYSHSSMCVQPGTDLLAGSRSWTRNTFTRIFHRSR
jgi:hypothetical protein